MRLPVDNGAKQLAFIRIVACALLLISSLWEQLTSVLVAPESVRQSMGVIDALPATWTHNSLFLHGVEAVTVAALLLALLGWRTRIVVPIAAFGYLLETGIIRAYSAWFHTGIVPLYVLIVLALLPCGDAWSLDARAGRTRRKPADIYRWSVLCAWAVIAASYTMAGLSKLRFGGLAWFAPDTLRGHVAGSSYSTILPFDFGLETLALTFPDWLWTLLAVGAVACEAGYIAVLVSRRARLIFPLLAVGLHGGIWLLQGVFFFDLMLIQVVFVNAEWAWSYATRFFSRRFSSSSRWAGWFNPRHTPLPR